MVGERRSPSANRLALTAASTLIFGEYDAVLVDAMTTVAEAEALADWIALHNRYLETIYITRPFRPLPTAWEFYLTVSRALRQYFNTQDGERHANVHAFTPPVERLARTLFPAQLATRFVAPQPYERDTFYLEGTSCVSSEAGPYR